VRWPTAWEDVNPGTEQTSSADSVESCGFENEGAGKLRTGTVREPGGKATSAVGSRYEATAIEDFMSAEVTVIFGA
jgi:hypothetical protein